jgi:hypothetical protein
MSRIEWGQVLERAAELVRSYDTPVTLRQLHYRLVSEQVIPNTRSAYKTLSERTAEARRDGTFPDLTDRGRTIHRYECWGSAEDALADALRYYRLDRTRGQEWSVYLGVEKAGLLHQLQAWFGDLGIGVLALGGYASQSFVSEVVDHIKAQTLGDRLTFDTDPYKWWRPAVLLYGGDFDPSGEDIDRDFVERVGCWEKVVRVALNVDQVREYRLPVNFGKVADSRSAGFIERHGALMQVELDALDPPVLRELFQRSIDVFWDTSAYRAVLAQEADDMQRLAEATRSLS